MLIFELLDGDSPGFMQVRQQVSDFLVANEHKCVSLVSHFKKKDVRIFYIVDERNSLWGVFSISSGGQILHCFESDTVMPFVQEFFSVNRPEKLFSIIGEQKFTNEIAKIFLNLYGTLPKSATEYSLMEYSRSAAEAELLNPKSDRTRIGSVTGCEVFDCKDSDFEEMFPLQKAYELEEVVIDKANYNEKNSRILLRKSIQDGNVFGLRCNNRIVAKASINAIGEKCIQLGGVYTDIGFRNKGLATYLIRTIITRFKNEGKQLILFVKKTNKTAENVYLNCGFIIFNEYKIIYY